MKEPLVSIIIPCWNAAQYIEEAIRSAVDQTYSNCEIIVVDDGSTDGSLDVIRSFAEVRLESAAHQGACAARNRGISIARGELIQFLDADDILCSNKIERQVALALEDRNRVVFCDYEREWFTDISSRVEVYSPRFNESDPVLFFLKCPLQTSAPLHWKEMLQSVGGFRPGLAGAHERDLHLRLACAGIRFRHLPKVLFRVRKVPGGISRDTVNVLNQHASIVWHVVQTLDQCGSLTDARAKGCAELLASDARTYLRCGMTREGINYFRQARLIHHSGGLQAAYSRPGQVVHRILGPLHTERVITVGRYLRRLAEFTRSGRSMWKNRSAKYRRSEKIDDGCLEPVGKGNKVA